MSFDDRKTCPPTPASRVSGVILDLEDDRFSKSKITPKSPQGRRRTRLRNRAPAVVLGGGRTSILILLLFLLPLSCNPSNDNTDTGELICSDDDPFDIEQCPDSYPDLECTVYVDGDVESSGDGWSWDSAVKTVQEGVDLAHCGAEVAGICAQWEVWVKKGTYYIHKGCREHSVRMREKTVLLGGFDGTETSEWDRDWVENETVLSGYDTENGTNRVFNVVRGSDNATIDGFTITGGNADEEGTQSVHAAGGGMSNHYASPIIENCIFEENFGRWGSAIDNYNNTESVPTTITGCTIRNNTQEFGSICMLSVSVNITDCEITNNSGIEGGGIVIEESELNIESSHIRNNSTTSHGGGIIAVSNSSLSISESFFTDNHTDNYGGAILVKECLFEISDTDFIGNIAANGGGAIAIDSSTGGVYGSSFEGNSTTYGGGAVWFEYCTLDIDSTTFENNAAEWGGGGFWYDSEVTLTNTVFTGNTATDSGDSSGWDDGKGGAIQSAGSNTTIVNSTFSANTATLDGSAVHSSDWLDGNNESHADITTITNSILWGEDSQQISWDDTAPEVTYSDITGGFVGDGNIDADPLLVDAAGGDLHLTAGSPCIGAADPAAAPETDIEGNVRDGEPDMGAYEF